MGVRVEAQASGPGGDQVAAVRDWLRERGIDPGPSTAMPREAPGASRPASADLEGDPAAADRAVESGSRPSGGPSSGRGARDGRRAGGGARAGRGRSARDSGPEPPEEEAGGPAGLRPRGGAGLDPDTDPEDVARQIVLRKLAVQARTRSELERALQQKAVPAEAATTVLDRMGEVGLVDDATFARDWVASRQQRRHLSRTALRRELQTKGVDRDTIDEALTGVDGSDEHRAALDLARRRAATMGGLPREVAYRRLGGMLARRGFSAGVTARVLGEVLDQPDED